MKTIRMMAAVALIAASFLVSHAALAQQREGIHR
jgi:hypothetical protein